MMNDPIERENVTETFAELYDIFDDCPTIVEELHKVYDKILAIPSAEPEKVCIGVIHFDDEKLHEIANEAVKKFKEETEPKRGEWTNAGVLTVQCSNCKSQFHGLEAMNFCPNCGAHMKGADDETH